MIDQSDLNLHLRIYIFFCFYLQHRLIQTSQTGFFRVLDETKESGDNRRKSTKQKQNFPPEINWRENRDLERELERERERERERESGGL
jgi:hypothetical protein